MSFVLVLILLACSQVKNKVADYKEAADPHPDTLANWDGLAKGLQSSFVSTLVRYPKCAIPNVLNEHAWSGEGWRGERISTQILLWSTDSIEHIEVKFSDFVSKTNQKIPASVAKAEFVRYVLTDEYGGGCDKRKPSDFGVWLVPDVLDHLSSFTMEAKTSQPVWVTIDVPENAEAGNYQSTIMLSTKNQIVKELTINIEVINRVLPKPAYWEYYLDLWQNPYSVSRFHNVKVWSNEHWSLLKPLMKLLADAGQKAITVSINNRPWGTQTEDPYESMIVWTNKKDGTWSYDYSIFDKWVEFMMDLGVKKQISCYSLVPWGNEFYYFDEKTNKEVKLLAKPGTTEYTNLLTPFLKDFRAHLEKKGWNKITLMAMDERAPEEMKAMIKFVNDIAPEFGFSLADSHKSYKLYPDQLKDLSVMYGDSIEVVDLKYRKAHKLVSTYYVACGQSFPNVYTFSPPAEGMFISWYAMANDFDGFLRWAYNNWVKDPLTDSRFRTWPAGDCYIVYPEARSSVRFEMLRDGIEDAEKIRILMKQFIENKDVDNMNKLNELVKLFKSSNKPTDINSMVTKAQSELNNLSKTN